MTAGSFKDLLRIHAASAAALQDQFEQVGSGPFHQEMKAITQELAESNKLGEKLSIELRLTMVEAQEARDAVARLRDHIRYLETVSKVHDHDNYEQLKKDYAGLLKVNRTLHLALDESQKECAELKHRVRNISDNWKQLSGGL